MQDTTVHQRFADNLCELVAFCADDGEHATTARNLLAPARADFDWKFDTLFEALLAGQPGDTAIDRLMHLNPAQRAPNIFDNII